ncbi:MAG: CobW family GTP-binding protein [Bacillota bacterium]
MKTKVDIISGFLGAGKTTLIKKLLEENLHGEKLAIVENEFGEVGIDGSLLKESGIEVKEINSGCICCTLIGDFEKSITEVITKFNPERIIIEPSGVGKLSEVIKACQSPKLKDLLQLNMIMTVVDVLKYDMYISNFSEFYENQIKNAKTIILSRTQKVQDEKLESVAKSMRRLNDKANIVTTPWEKLSAESIISVAQEDLRVSLEQQLIKSNRIVLKRHSHHASCKCGSNHGSNHTHHEGCGCSGQSDHMHNADEIFEVWGAETPRKFEKSELRSILESINSNGLYGMILRGKGILQSTEDKWIQFDFVPGEINFKEMEADYTGRVCFIGKDLNKQEIGRLFYIN